MTDVHSPEIRSKNMRAIRSKDTLPEMLVRRGLHAAGLRYSLHSNESPRNSGFSIPAAALSDLRSWLLLAWSHRLQVLQAAQSRPEFWRNKIGTSILNGAAAVAELLRTGWCVAIVWECALKQKNRTN